MNKIKLHRSILTLFFLISCGQDERNIKTQSPSDTIRGGTETAQLRDTTVQFLWREMTYDSILKDSVSSLTLNRDYLHNASEPEKAALGYVATFIGNECWWDGGANENRSNLDCKIITALGLGYQCSDTHIGFLKKWFSEDDSTLSELDKSKCPTTPYTATIQNTFDEIMLFVDGNSITVNSKLNHINIREQINRSWSETHYFNLENNRLKLLKKEQSEPE